MLFQCWASIGNSVPTLKHHQWGMPRVSWDVTVAYRVYSHAHNTMTVAQPCGH